LRFFRRNFWEICFRFVHSIAELCCKVEKNNSPLKEIIISEIK
jgi:hypothetical protein